MNVVSATLTVFFEDPFWVGLLERTCNRRYEVCKITFGPEPSDGEVYAFYLSQGDRLVFSPSAPGSAPEPLHVSPKRMQREAGHMLRRTPVSTRAQQALALAREEGKSMRQENVRARRALEEQRRFALRQNKRKEKHRGR